MVEYTQEDLWELAARIPDNRKDPMAYDLRGVHDIDAFGWVLEPDDVYLYAEGKNIYLTTYDKIPEHTRMRYLLYTKPLEDMPLYINDPVDIYRIVATWRLAISK